MLLQLLLLLRTHTPYYVCASYSFSVTAVTQCRAARRDLLSLGATLCYATELLRKAQKRLLCDRLALGH